MERFQIVELNTKIMQRYICYIFELISYGFKECILKLIEYEKLYKKT